MATDIVDAHDRYYRGVRTVPYDIVKELVIALGVVTALVLALSFVFSSPDLPPLTIRGWAATDPVDFVTTATGELSGSTTTGGYGPPYNTAGSGQSWGPLAPVQWAGVHQPVDAANLFVLSPLQTASASDANLASALSAYSSASDKQQSAWLDAYTAALSKATVGSSNQVIVASGDYGPVPELTGSLLRLAQSGALDGQLQDAGHFYNTDYTRSLLFMGDGGVLSSLASNQHLLGNQWGMMSETGSYPGQSWLWLYTFWYQVWPFTSDKGFLGLNSANADLGVVLIMGLLTTLLALVPFIPVLRDIPRWVPVHRLIWRGDHWKERLDASASVTPAPAARAS
ncbi:MAG TPA: hypothetical protein VF137_05355 [Candidatus Dormibacteraeota bacterium]